MSSPAEQRRKLKVAGSDSVNSHTDEPPTDPTIMWKNIYSHVVLLPEDQEKIAKIKEHFDPKILKDLMEATQRRDILKDRLVKEYPGEKDATGEPHIDKIKTPGELKRLLNHYEGALGEAYGALSRNALDAAKAAEVENKAVGQNIYLTDMAVHEIVKGKASDTAPAPSSTTPPPGMSPGR